MNSNQKILFDCKKATFHIEKELQTRLSLRESLELKLHLAGCSVCRLYQSQSILIGAMVKQILKQHKVPGLDDQFKIKLQQQIDFQHKNEH